MFRAILSSFESGTISSLPLALWLSANGSTIRMQSMFSGHDFKVESFHTKFVSLQNQDVVVQADATRGDDGIWTIGPYEPSDEYGYFYPDEVRVIYSFFGLSSSFFGAQRLLMLTPFCSKKILKAFCVVEGRSARAFFIERNILHIPEPELAANLSLVVPPVLWSNCNAQQVVVKVEVFFGVYIVFKRERYALTLFCF